MTAAFVNTFNDVDSKANICAYFLICSFPHLFHISSCQESRLVE